MDLFKPYSNIKDFLYRFTLIKIGKLHIRLHKIMDKDSSTLFHNHPFHYISFILKGGYTETYINSDNKHIDKSHSFGSLIIRKRDVFHRIVKLKDDKPAYTLFIAYGNYGWKAFNTLDDKSNDGLFERVINDKKVWSKKENGIWFIGNKDKEIAKNETRHSIHQIL